jgi:hypothetical protein
MSGSKGVVQPRACPIASFVYDPCSPQQGPPRVYERANSGWLDEANTEYRIIQETTVQIETAPLWRMLGPGASAVLLSRCGVRD